MKLILDKEKYDRISDTLRVGSGLQLNLPGTSYIAHLHVTSILIKSEGVTVTIEQTPYGAAHDPFLIKE